jgi:hypothetical protein
MHLSGILTVLLADIIGGVVNVTRTLHSVLHILSLMKVSEVL